MDKRLNHISFLQVIGPIFVILGHSTNSMPSSNAYYIFTKVWIYIFHMPLFFFISGYLFSYKGGLSGKNYRNFIMKKFQRLLIPYILWNTLFIIPKILLSKFLVDDVEYSLSYFYNLIITPRANIWGHTWFLAALFLLFLIAPIFNFLLHIKRNKFLVWGVLTIILVLLYLNPINTNRFALMDLSKDTLFFWIGIMLGTVSPEKLKSIVRKSGIAISIFLATIILTIVSISVTEIPILTMVTCLFTIIALLILPLKFNLASEFIDRIAKRSFGIYILHWPVMITVRILFYQVMNVNRIKSI